MSNEELEEIIEVNWNFLCVWFTRLFFVALLMSGMRYVVFDHLLTSNIVGKIPWGEIFQIFFMGFRFDLMACAFLLIPILFLTLIRYSLAEWIHKGQLVFFSSRYSALLWCLMVLMYAVNTHFFLSNFRHMRLEDWLELKELSKLSVFIRVELSTPFLFNLLLLIGFCYLGFRILLNVEDFYKDPKKNVIAQTFPRAQIWFKALFPLVLVAFFARGRLGAHHLDARHAKVSQRPVLNELVLNPLWTFDKSRE